jgi:hypothetical protein
MDRPGPEQGSFCGHIGNGTSNAITRRIHITCCKDSVQVQEKWAMSFAGGGGGDGCRKARATGWCYWLYVRDLTGRG